VAEQDEALAPGVAEMREASRQRANVLAMDLDELQRARLRLRLAADCRMHRLDEGALAGAAGAPQKRIVGGKAAREADSVVVEHVTHPVDALEQGKRHAIDVSDGQKGLRLGLPDESFSLVE